MIDHVAEQTAIDGWVAGDRDAGRNLLKMHSGVIFLIARRYVGSMCEEEDLVQEASIALLGATARYTPEHGLFITFARRPMKWACNDYARTLRHDLHVSKGAEVGARSFEDPTVKIGASDAKTARVNRVAIERAMVRAVRLDDLVGDGDETWMNRVAAPANDIVAQLDLSRLRLRLVDLKPREREVLSRRCGDEPETFEEIGVSMGVTKQCAKQIEGRAIAVLQKRMRAA